MICKRCGKPIKYTSLKCGSCGTKNILQECSGFDCVPKRVFFNTAQKAAAPVMSEDTATFSKKNIALIAGVIAVVMAAVAMGSIVFFKGKDNSGIPDEGEQVVDNQTDRDYSESPVRFATLGKANREVKSEEDAVAVLEDVSGIYGYTDVKSQLRYAGESVSSEYAEHYIFNQICEGKRVYGKSVIITVARDGNEVIVVAGNYKAINGKLEKTEVTAEEAKEKAQKAIKGNVKTEPENVVICVNKPKNTWLVSVETDDGVKDVFVDAKNGRMVLEKEEHIATDTDAVLAKKALDEIPEVDKDKTYVTTENTKMAVVRVETENIPFDAPVVSNSLYEMNIQLSDDPVLAERIISVWKNAVYLLPAEADFVDCLTAADLLADRGMLSLQERLTMLTMFESYHKIPESKIEIMGPDNEFTVYGEGDKPFYDYTYKIQVCDENLVPGEVCASGAGTEGMEFKFESGKIYCITISEKGNNNPNDARKEFIYCTDIDADYELYTKFKTDSGVER